MPNPSAHKIFIGGGGGVTMRLYIICFIWKYCYKNHVVGTTTRKRRLQLYLYTYIYNHVFYDPLTQFKSQGLSSSFFFPSDTSSKF
jgi:hypothetical protein